MNLAKLTVVKEWLASWKSLRKNPLYLLSSGLIDIVFFITFGLLTAPIFDKLTQHVIIIGSLVSELMRAPAGRARPAVVDALFMEPVKQFTWQFFGLLLLLAVTIFVLYCILHGFCWFMAIYLAGKKTSWKKHMIGFARVNLLWFGLFVAWFATDAIFDLRRLVVEKASGQPDMTSAVVLYVVLLAIIYLALLSYPSLSIKSAFSRNITAAFPAIVLVIIHFLAGNLVVTWLGQLNQTLMFVAGAIILFVLMAWARLYIARSVKRV